MVVAFGFRDTEADWDDVVPRWVGHIWPISEVVLDMESQFITTDPQRAVGEQWGVCAAVGVGDSLVDQHIFAEHLNANSLCGPAAGGVQDVGRQMASGLRHARPG